MSDDSSVIRALAEAWRRHDQEVTELARQAIAAGKRLAVGPPRLEPGAMHRKWGEGEPRLIFDHEVVDADAEAPPDMVIITPEMEVEALRQADEENGA